jgi:RHH-type rel operon transcriptional repressor/antitoxin RelB
MFAIRLPHDIEARLAALARTTARTKSHYVREAIELYLARLEREYSVDKAQRLGRAKPARRSVIRR